MDYEKRLPIDYYRDVAASLAFPHAAVSLQSPSIRTTRTNEEKFYANGSA